MTPKHQQLKNPQVNKNLPNHYQVLKHYHFLMKLIIKKRQKML